MINCVPLYSADLMFRLRALDKFRFIDPTNDLNTPSLDLDRLRKRVIGPEPLLVKPREVK